MNNIKNEFKFKSYQINPLILKNIKNINIDLNEFLLLIYFINEKESLDLEDIKIKTSLSEEEILNSYSSLLNKGLIEIKMTKENGKISEKIDIESFYNKLVLNIKDEKEVPKDIYAKFEAEFGKTLSPIEYETINKWIEKGISEEVIESALKEAVVNGVTSLRYIDKIIYEWTKKGTKKNDEEYEELFDYDWLGEEDD